MFRVDMNDKIGIHDETVVQDLGNSRPKRTTEYLLSKLRDYAERCIRTTWGICAWRILLIIVYL